MYKLADSFSKTNTGLGRYNTVQYELKLTDFECIKEIYLDST